MEHDGAHLRRRSRLLLDPLVLVVVAACLLSRLCLAWAGVGMDMAALGPRGADHYWQLLDLGLLRGDLLASVWSLTMQPPLYNLSIGLLLQLPEGWQQPVVAVALTACFAVAGAATYLTMVVLGLRRSAALLVTLLFVAADPGWALFSTRPFYALPTAMLVTLAALAAALMLRRPSTRSALAFTAAAATAALFNTSVQPLLVLLVIGLVFWLAPELRRPLLVGGAVPVLLLVGWTGLQLSRVATPATSTWLGMNLAHVTLRQAPPEQISRMISEGQLSEQAAIPPFSELRRYGIAPVRIGPEASSAAVRRDGQPNLNNRAYAEVSRRYLSDDLSYIRHQPGHYAAMVSRGLRIWSVPEDQYYFFFPDAEVQGWERAYDRWVMLQPTRNPFLPLAALANQAVAVDQISGTLVAETALAAIATPVIVVAAFRRRRRWALSLAVPWALFMGAFLATSLSENGENNRFRFETGTVMLTLSAVVVGVLVDRLPGRRSPGAMEGRIRSLGWEEADEPAGSAQS